MNLVSNPLLIDLNILSECRPIIDGEQGCAGIEWLTEPVGACDGLREQNTCGKLDGEIYDKFGKNIVLMKHKLVRGMACVTWSKFA
jgi:hypothetical protein